ncbi:type III polyketide synthase [Rhizobium sp. BK251]|uniref:type III polyketide synthase n=1 Tax=Rhizobium sp. BK251 TaxID=2512125 RepID=UPI00104D75D5|nr:type III polyketide synthase [Rhizobium sp. BK251]TCL75711.1 (2-(2,4-dihydroxy-6-methylphenyl)-2- oxoethyl)-4-hydroxy-2-pyrone synthase [Rhizobium sp. BK251]
MTNAVKLVSLAVSAPEHVINQSEAAEAAAQMFSGRFKDFKHLARVFDNAGIRTRHTARPLSWFMEPHGWQDRMDAYQDEAEKLFVNVASMALERAGMRASDVDCVVTTSTTGFTVPSIEARMAETMGFRGTIQRVPLFGLGCAGGVSGLAIASRLAAGRPGSVVLFVSIELCSLAFRLDELTRPNIIATALFGDGAAACVLRAGEEGLAEIESTGEHLFPSTLGIMGWKVDNTGLGIILDQALPPFAQEHVGPAIANILNRSGLRIDDIDRFVCHPGGTKVLRAIESALSLEPDSLGHERDVLTDYGNMSSPTVLFVLDQVIKDGLPRRAAMVAMGPGFTASCVTLRRAA